MRRDNLKRYLPFFAVILIFAVSLAISFRGLRDHHALERTKLANTRWIVSQLEIEYLRFVDAFDRVGLGDALTERTELTHRYDILLSRLPLFLEGEMGERFGHVPGVHETVGRLREQLLALEPDLLNLQQGDRDAYLRIRTQLDAFLMPVHQTVLASFLQREAETAFQSDGLRQAFFVMMGSSIGIVVSGGLLIVFLLRQLRRAGQAEREAMRARQLAEEASRAKSDFLAQMSHEFRTPLNAVIGFAQVMEQEMLGPIGNARYKGYVGDIHASSMHLLRLINDTLDLSKIEAGRYELREGEVDLKALITQSVRLFREQAQNAGVALGYDVGKPLPEFCADGQAVSQILFNLISNAIKFTQPGGSVSISAEVDPDGALLLAVADTGVGIAEEDTEKALSAFGQIESPLNRRHMGTGLGLAITRHLVALHGGELRLDSELGVGTTVTAVFPPQRLSRNRRAVA